MPKTLLCKITLLISWVVLFFCQQAKGSSLFRNQLPNEDFPYEFWKPSSSQSLPTPEQFVGESHSENYNSYYGHPIISEQQSDASTWVIPPIKVPKDVVGDVNERTTVRSSPKDVLASYPSSFSPQYGRHPGGTEAPPLIFPQRFASKNSLGANNYNVHSSYSHYTPMESPTRRQFWAQNFRHQHPNPPTEQFFPSEAKPNYIPPRIINILSIDRNQEPSPHVFYAVEHPSQVEMKILQKNGSHVSYITPTEQRRQFIVEQKEKTRSQKKRVHKPITKQKYNWNYNKHYQKTANHPYRTKKRYNENLIELFKDKIENRVRKTFETISSTPYSVRKPIYRKESDIKRKALLPNNYNVNFGNNFINEPTVESYKNASKFTYYVATPLPFIPHASNINPKYTKAHPQVVYPTRPHQAVNYNSDHSNVHNIFHGETTGRIPEPAPNAYPETIHSNPSDASQNYLYVYDKNKEEESEKYGFDFNAQSFLERMAGIQQLPVSLVLPGGLAALGFGLAYYYFNYIWYPTPVVTARLSEFLRSFGSHENLDRSTSDSSIRKIVEVFRAIESAQFNSEFGKDSCRNRIVCQLHQDIPSLWEATSIISPLLRSKQPNSSEFENVINTYLQTAKLGSQSTTSCKHLYSTCKLPYLSLKPLLNFFFTSKEKKTMNGESRTL